MPGIGLAMLRLDAIEQYRLKGGDFVAGSTHVMPRLDEAEESLAVNVGLRLSTLADHTEQFCIKRAVFSPLIPQAHRKHAGIDLA